MLRQRWRALPQLVRFMLRSFADGVALGWSCGLLLLWFDLGGLGSMLAGIDNGWVTALFFLQGGTLFGTAAASVAVMNLGDDGR